MFRIAKITVEIPALDRLLDFLEANQQKEIDTLSDQVARATQTLKQSTDRLQKAVSKGK